VTLTVQCFSSCLFAHFIAITTMMILFANAESLSVSNLYFPLRAGMQTLFMKFCIGYLSSWLSFTDWTRTFRYWIHTILHEEAAIRNSFTLNSTDVHIIINIISGIQFWDFTQTSFPICLQCNLLQLLICLWQLKYI